ncbi:MAG: UDP-N-acetylmuramoyl-L-alanine--D-glutamate ligase [bacterium]
MHGKYDQVHAFVLGASKSGEWSARLLLARGGRVTLLDESDGEKLSEVAERVRTAGGDVLFGKRALPEGVVDVCVASPAFALSHVWIQACTGRGIPVISELELGAEYWRGKMIAITGSKGKSSLVKFCADTLNLAGVPASPAGNYGIPLCQLVMEKPDLSWAVVEVSSFQMEHSPTFHPHIALLLNLQPDHLDRHADLAEYKQLKFNMFSNMDEHDIALLPTGLNEEGLMNRRVPCYRFGAEQGSDWQYKGGIIIVNPSPRGNDPEAKVHEYGTYLQIRGLWFDNEILGLAAAAGCAILSRTGLSKESILQGFTTFKPLSHRVQVIGTDARGVTWVDDSKATSLTATAAALRMVKKPVRLIAGGLLKEKDLVFLKELLTQTTQKVYLIGHCAGEMENAWALTVPCEIYGTIDRAVAAAAQEAQSNETVLLSPGTASFDQFSSYQERGDRFTQLVRAVANL